MKVKICARCGKEFVLTSGGQKYCKECGIINKKERYIERHKQWRETHREEINEASRKYYKAHPEKKRESGKKWSKANPEKVREKSSRWYHNHLEKASEIHRKWQKVHQEKVNENNRKWRKAYPERVEESIRKYYKTYPERVKESNKKWRQLNPEKVKEYSTKRKRNLGFVPINNYKKGLVGHHINREYVVYIPEKLHQSIHHSVTRDTNMDKINTEILKYLKDIDEKLVELVEKLLDKENDNKTKNLTLIKQIFKGGSY